MDFINLMLMLLVIGIGHYGYKKNKSDILNSALFVMMVVFIMDTFALVLKYRLF